MRRPRRNHLAKRSSPGSYPWREDGCRGRSATRGAFESGEGVGDAGAGEGGRRSAVTRLLVRIPVDRERAFRVNVTEDSEFA